MITNFNNDSITKIVDQILNYDETSLHYSSENPLGQLNQLIINEITFDKKIIESEYLIEKKLTKILKQIFSHLNNNKNRSKFIENISKLHSKEITYLDNSLIQEIIQETKSVGNLKIIEWKTIAIFSSIMLISMIFIFKYINIGTVASQICFNFLLVLRRNFAYF